MAKFVSNEYLRGEDYTLYMKGEVNSVTAPEVEKEIMEAVKKKTFKNLILNFGEVTYVSSAGLRVMLKLKKLYPTISVTDTSLSIYDVFQMTGFTNIMSVSKALVKVSVIGCEVIGEGYCAIVYRLDKDTIVKAYRKNTDIKDVERELNLAKEAFVLGIPTAISYDVVRVGDKLGVRFEMIDSLSLRKLFLDQPNKFNEILDKYIELLKKTNNTEALNASLPKAKQQWLEKGEAWKGEVEEKDYKKIMALLRTIPERETFIHGDSHFKNIMVQNGELLFIDMDTLSVGDPIFELSSGIYMPYLAFEEDQPGNNEGFLGVSSQLSEKIAYGVIEGYLGRKEKSDIDKIRIVSLIHFLWWTKQNEPENKARMERIKKRLLPMLPDYDDLDLGLKVESV
ncbi:MAG: phosphotransferase [Bacilli bacterium]|nr:phosphotransferase [Bacilli bacterium]